MSNTGWSIARVAAAAALVSTLPLGCAGPDAGKSASLTAQAWSKDKYVTPTDPRGTSMNAARVLAMPERPAQRTMQVGASVAVLHEKASATSRAVATVSAGDAVKVLAEGNFVRIPATGEMREYVGVSGGDITPAWVKVSTGGKEGWIPARALVSPVELATSSEALASSRAAEGGGKGFSEKVRREASAMKGAAGTPKVKGANYAAADAIIARASKPLNFGDPGNPWKPSPRLEGLPAAGQSLQQVDGVMAAEAAKATAKANEPSEFAKAADGAMDLLGKVGIKQADDPAVKAGVEATKLVESFSRPYPVTPVEERVLGRECLAVLVGDSKVLPDTHPASCYVRWVGTRLAANSTAQYPSIGLDFIVLDDPKEINAVAVPGGPIIITTGMLNFLKSEDELAAILGHEISHVEERHGMKIAVGKGMQKWPALISFCEMQANGQSDKWLAGVVAKAKLPDAVAKQVPALVSSQLTSALKGVFEDAVYASVDAANKGADQGVETGADLRGMSLASAAGYDPAALDATLERLKTMTGQYGGSNYDPKRAELERSVVGLLPAPQGAAKVATDAGKTAPVRTVTPSKEAADRWAKLHAALNAKS